MPSSESTSPWVLDIASLAHLHGTRPYPKATILVLNTPSPADLVALLYESPALEQSLIIIATHDVPVIPPPPTTALKDKVVDPKNKHDDVVPTVRVLKMRESWSLDGAFGVMTALDKAAKFAASYHGQSDGSTRQSEKVCIYHEDLTTGEFSPAVDMKKTRRRTFSLFSSQSQWSSPSPTPGSTALSTVTSGTRPFDALIHCINSPSQPQGDQDRERFEKAILKQAILVTTLSAPYLAVPPDPPKYLRLPSASTSAVNINSNVDQTGSKRLRRNTLQTPASAQGHVGPRLGEAFPSHPFAEPQSAARYSGRSHILHILPMSLLSRPTSPPRASTSKAKATQPAFDSKHRLLHGIENFLVAFAYSRSHSPPPMPSSHSTPSLANTSSSTSSTELKKDEKPIPYILRAGGIRGAVRLDSSTSAKATLAECTLLGYIHASSKLLPKAWVDVDDPKALIMKTSEEEAGNAIQKPQASDLQHMQEQAQRSLKRKSAPPCEFLLHRHEFIPLIMAILSRRNLRCSACFGANQRSSFLDTRTLP
ncbi:hypothetical protein EST38_g3814 [Candolleomyces aberdarensis]|uniref:Uncharacterized protein n=1 Tax=Candolleomyces aberdarensis TaxID=2316362 RepID=A0A4Q2DS37_9AGAR|nr:hypothetical protein EST38_g3814 [Candolleomyces aberdarensis]